MALGSLPFAVRRRRNLPRIPLPCLVSRLRATLDASKHPGLHDVMAKGGGNQHKRGGMRANTA
jgi:hypothetical protein